MWHTHTHICDVKLLLLHWFVIIVVCTLLSVFLWLYCCCVLELYIILVVIVIVVDITNVCVLLLYMCCYYFSKFWFARVYLSTSSYSLFRGVCCVCVVCVCRTHVKVSNVICKKRFRHWSLRRGWWEWVRGRWWMCRAILWLVLISLSYTYTDLRSCQKTQQKKNNG